MFLDRLLQTNEGLARCAFEYHRAGILSPDTYVIDLDMVTRNAELILDAANANDLSCYFMLKQLGRNPLVARRLQDLGFAGAVCVDWRDAEAMMTSGIRLGHVGHLVQIPDSKIPGIIDAQPEVVTVYSVEKARRLGLSAAVLGRKQRVLLRVIGPNDEVYPGQHGGFGIDDLPIVVSELEKAPGVEIAGVCSFPCIRYMDSIEAFQATPNTETVRTAAGFLDDRGYENLQLNMPSANCVESMGMVRSLGGTHVEPGHGLTGTTPYHAKHAESVEGVGYLYLSEISHNLGSHSFCFGGGHYRRGHIKDALVGNCFDKSRRVGVIPPSYQSIDYHFELTEEAEVGDAVVMCFRTQMFVTRSEVAVVSGVENGRPSLKGIFDSQGRKIG